MALKTPIIAIVGRPNVGKSTLFNRVLGEKRAVVEDIPGVTRDRNYAYIEKYAIDCMIVDTGGFDKLSERDNIQQQVVDQALAAVEEADIILAVFDGQDGLHPGDEEVVSILRRYDKPTIYLVNKVDGIELSGVTAEFYQLGISEIEHASALHGRGVNDIIKLCLKTLPNYKALVDSAKAKREKEKLAAQIEIERNRKYIEEVAELIKNEEAIAKGAEDKPKEDSKEEEKVEEEQFFAPVFFEGDDAKKYEKEFSVKKPVKAHGNLALKEEQEPLPEIDYNDLTNIRIAIVGKPNVGKSTLLNTLTGEKRALTSPEAGTTRDPLDVLITREGIDYRIVDTAGLRKQGRISERIEKLSAMRSIRAISECDVALIVMDAEQGPTEQDAKIIGLAHDQGKGIVLVVNKWDKITKNHKSVKEFEQKLRDTFKFATYAPIVYISALSGKRCPKVITTANMVANQRNMRIPTSRLNRTLQKAFRRKSPAFYRGREVKLYFAAQVSTSPPRLALFLNFPKEIHFSYLRYLKNNVRREFGFIGTDVKFSLRKKNQT